MFYGDTAERCNNWYKNSEGDKHRDKLEKHGQDSLPGMRKGKEWTTDLRARHAKCFKPIIKTTLAALWRRGSKEQ